MNKMILTIPIIFLAGAGGSYFMFAKGETTKEAAAGEHGAPAAEGGEHGAATDSAETAYVPLDPAMIVNIRDAAGNARFLQVSLEVRVSDTATSEAVKKHMPAIRNDLLMRMTGHSLEELDTAEGKNKLREATLTGIREILTGAGAAAKVDQVFYTSFVMQ